MRVLTIFMSKSSLYAFLILNAVVIESRGNATLKIAVVYNR